MDHGLILVGYLQSDHDPSTTMLYSRDEVPLWFSEGTNLFWSSYPPGLETHPQTCLMFE